MATKKKTQPSANGMGRVESTGNRFVREAEPEPFDQVVVLPIEQRTVEIPIAGITPLIICNFSRKILDQMEQAQTCGPNKVKKQKEAKDIQACYQGARYIADPEGWDGCNAVGFRGAMISACRLVDGLAMTNAKQLVFIEADGYEAETMIPLVRIEGEPKMHRGTVRVGPQKTADLRYRPLFWPWKAVIRITFNPQWISSESLANLLAIAGHACGVGEWRPTAPKSVTGSYGRWKIA